MLNAQETYDELVLVHGVSNVKRYYQLWEEHQLSLLQSKCDVCGALGIEATSIAYPKRLCETCGLAEEAKHMVCPLPVKHQVNGQYTVEN